MPILCVSGTVKWVGVLHDESIAPELYVGVRLDDNGNIAYIENSSILIFHMEQTQ